MATVWYIFLFVWVHECACVHVKYGVHTHVGLHACVCVCDQLGCWQGGDEEEERKKKIIEKKTFKHS